MKIVAVLLASVFAFSNAMGSSDEPRGTVIELHSCELYAGGCTVSSEATQGGQQLLRVWAFSSGSQCGVPIKDLAIALLQTSSENLATPGAESHKGVIYLPERASPDQRQALLSWLRTNVKELPVETARTRTVELTLNRSLNGYTFSAGQYASFQTASLEACEPGSCGEALWYAPRSQASVFTVGVNRASDVDEPLLKVKWSDARKRSVFVGRFGENTGSKIYVNYSDLCGPAVL